MKLEELGLKANQDQIEEILLKVKLQAEKTKLPLTDSDFEKIVRELIQV